MKPERIKELRNQVEDRFPEQWATLPVPTANELLDEIERLQKLMQTADVEYDCGYANGNQDGYKEGFNEGWNRAKEAIK